MKHFCLLAPLLLVGLPLHAQPCTVRFERPASLVWHIPERPTLDVVVKGVPGDTVPVSFVVSTDKGAPIVEMKQSLVLTADSAGASFAFTPAEPGFYSCRLSAPDAEGEVLTVGFEPESILSLPDKQADFDAFWQQSLDELATVAPEYAMQEEKDKSGKDRKVYRVSMKSFGGEHISGYLTMPVRKGRYPVLISYMGYNNKPWYAKPEEHPDYIQFVLSVRGQGLEQPGNNYGEWAVYGLDSKEDYYYRGAFMDLIRAIDFVCQLPEADSRYIFAEGGSQGGAFTLVACALDNRIAAAAPWIPFLSDFPDYFRIVGWPYSIIHARQQELKLSDDALYRTLSYFDVKNHADKIHCPILMAYGGQDDVCPPHTNFAGYNRISSAKQYVEYPYSGHHNIDYSTWIPMQFEFFDHYIQTHK